MTALSKTPLTDQHIKRKGGAAFAPDLFVEFCRWIEKQFHKRGLELSFARAEITKKQEEINRLKVFPPGIKGVVENEIIENIRGRIKEDYILRSEVAKFYVLKPQPVTPAEKIYWEYMQDLAFESLKKPEFRQPVKPIGKRLEELGTLSKLQQMEAV